MKLSELTVYLSLVLTTNHINPIHQLAPVTHHVLVVEQVYKPRRPLCHLDWVRSIAYQPQQTQRCTLLHCIQCVTAIIFTSWCQCVPPILLLHVSNSLFLGTARVHIRNCISIGSSISVGLTVVTNSDTDCRNKMYMKSTTNRSNGVLHKVPEYCYSGDTQISL